jgi:TonB family protein
MRSEDEKSGAPRPKAKSGEEAILEFLDKEISASPESVESAEPQLEDVDLLVNSLLRESIASSGEAPAEPEPAGDDIDKLFSNMFAKPKVESAPAAPPAPAMRAQAAAARREAQPVPARRPVPVARPAEPAVEAEAAPARVKAPAAAPQPERVPVFAMAAQKPAVSPRTFIIAGALACLLAGVGIVYYVGHKGNEAPTAAPPAATADAPAAPEITNPVVPPQTQAPVQRSAAVRTEPAPPASRRSAAATSGSPEADRNSKGGSPEADRTSKGGSPAAALKQAAAEPPPPAAAASSPASGTVLANPPDPASTLTISVSDTPPVNPLSRPADSASAQGATSVPAVRSQLSQLVPSAPGNLEGLSARDKVNLPLPSPQKRAVPAEVVSRVPPTYSEIARRSRATGTVVLDIAIDEQGKVTQATPVSGPAILRLDAVRAVLQWRFRPASLDGRSVPSTSRVTVVFK